MLQIKMEPSTRNFLVRLLENYKKSLQYTETNKRKLEYELNNIAVAYDRLMGKAPKLELNKNQPLVNFGLEEDK